MVAITPKPIRSNAVSSQIVNPGARFLSMSIKPSLRVNRPERKACGACRKTMATMESETSSGTPEIGERKKFRPATSAAISATSPKINAEPATFRSAVTPSRILRKRPDACGARPLLSWITPGPNPAMAWRQPRAWRSSKATKPPTPGCPEHQAPRPRSWRSYPYQQPMRHASRHWLL